MRLCGPVTKIHVTRNVLVDPFDSERLEMKYKNKNKNKNKKLTAEV